MKNILKFLSLLVVAFAMHSCTDDATDLSVKEKVQFSFDTGVLNTGRVASLDLPAGSKLLLSVETTTGESVLSFQEVELLEMGGSLITVPIQLAPGKYIIKDFMIADADDKVLYATPVKGSLLS